MTTSENADGPHDGTDAQSRSPSLIPLVVLSIAELAAAWVLSRTLVTWHVSHGPAEMDMGGGMRGMDMHGMTTGSSQASGAAGAISWVAVAVWAVLLGYWWFFRRHNRGRSTGSTVMACVAAAVGVAQLVPAYIVPASSSHLPMMAVLMSAMVAVPAIIVGGIAPTTTVGSPRATHLLMPVAVVFAALMVAAHVNPVMSWLMGSKGWVLPAYYLVCTAAGLALWSGLLLGGADAASRAARRRAVIVAVAPGALLALAFMIASQAAPGASVGVVGSAVLDQRLGGLLMMVTDAMAIIPFVATPRVSDASDFSVDAPD